MTARVGKIKITRDGDRVRIERVRGRRSVSARIGADNKSRREAEAWRRLAKGRAKVERKQ